jgi:flagellar motor switch/type III secretory pathway protein FliN
MPDDFAAKHLLDLQAAAARGKPAEGAALVRIPLIGSGRQGTMWLLWPAAAIQRVLTPAPATSSGATPAIGAPRAASPQETALDFEERLERLPSYARSLLKIKVPVVVTLASKRKPVEEILELGLGSILQFDKPCDETLELEIADTPVAVGEAVKVGDKFGLRVTGVVLPDERFKTIRHRIS